jgi:hypothetical protein
MDKNEVLSLSFTKNAIREPIPVERPAISVREKAYQK